MASAKTVMLAAWAACAVAVAGCGSSPTDEAASSTQVTVLAPMTSVAFDAAAQPSPAATPSPSAAPAEPNEEVPLPEGARRVQCQHFRVQSESAAQRPAQQGPVRFVDVSEGDKGLDVEFVLREFVPADFTATVVQVAADPEPGTQAQARGMRRLIVRDAQVQANYLKKGGVPSPFVGDFYTLTPDEGRVSVIIPSAAREVFSGPGQTVAAFISDGVMSRCVIGGAVADAEQSEQTNEDPAAEEDSAQQPEDNADEGHQASDQGEESEDSAQQ